MQFLVFFVIAVLVILAIVAAILMDQKRRKMWQDVAARLGLRYSRHDPHGLPSRYSKLALFNTGHSKKASNLIEGVHDGRYLMIFDYRYKTGSGKNQTTHNLSALCLSIELGCPYMIIRAESFFDKFTSFFGFDDIDFEYEEFNKKFHVQSDNKKFAYDICHSQTMDFLMNHQQLSWEIIEDRMFVYGLGTFDEAEIDYCVAASHGFLNLIPNYMKTR